MQRDRRLREYREKFLRDNTPKPRQTLQQIRLDKRKQRRIEERKKALQAQASSPTAINSGFNISFKDFKSYTPNVTKKIVVCHIIESLGLGGAQTMMLELISGLNRYFGNYSTNLCVYLSRKDFPLDLCQSYDVQCERVSPSEMKSYCSRHGVDIVVQHRIAVSKCIKNWLPRSVKYILVNHTWNNMWGLHTFLYCDVYVSVCKFLHDHSRFHRSVSHNRRVIILNGVENDYVHSVEAAELSGKFKTGRCHRCIPSKFDSSSIKWMHKSVASIIPGFTHYLIGGNKEVKQFGKKFKFFHPMGSIINRKEKMSVIKALDVYFYETFREEGASVAILESLACGIPVLSKPLGGCPELVASGINGFLVKDRPEYLSRLRQMANKEYLDKLKIQVATDFDTRLHIRHPAAKYMQIFETLFKTR